MRVAFLSASSELGGAERGLLDLLSALRDADAGVEPTVITTSDGRLVERARRLGAHTAILPWPQSLGSVGDSSNPLGGPRPLARTSIEALRASPAALRYVRELAALVRGLHPDVLHSNGMKFHVLTAWARPSNVPLVWHVRDFVRSRPIMSRLLRATRQRASCAIAVSEAVARDLRSCAPGLAVERVYDAVDVEEFSPGPGDGAALDRLAGVALAAAGTCRIGLVATYARWKGHDLFLEAAARVRARNARYYIVGGPIYGTRGSQFTRPELEHMAAARGVADRVAFVPFQDEPAKVYRSLDVVVHASTRPEPFGRTIAEAMAAGRPVVAAEDAGAAELLRASGAALLFAPNDPAALARALERLAHSSRLRSNTGSLAIATARALFDSRRLGPAMTAIYAHLRPGAHGAASGTAACRSGDEASPRTPM